MEKFLDSSPCLFAKMLELIENEVESSLAMSCSMEQKYCNRRSSKSLCHWSLCLLMFGSSFRSSRYTCPYVLIRAALHKVVR